MQLAPLMVVKDYFVILPQCHFCFAKMIGSWEQFNMYKDLQTVSHNGLTTSKSLIQIKQLIYYSFLKALNKINGKWKP